MDGPDPAAPSTGLLTVPLDAPAAQILADDAGIIQDLQFVIECCKRLLAELDKPAADRDPVVPQALWVAALVAYGRCFKQGKRFGLSSEDVAGLPLQGEVIKYHRWLLEERDKHTAHPANPFETARVGAALSPPGTPNRRVEGIAILAVSHVLVDDAGVRQLGGLASELAKQTADKAQAQQDLVLADTRKQGVDRLYDLPPLSVGAPADLEGAQGNELHRQP